MSFDLDRKAFMRLAREYRSRWAVTLYACDARGDIQFASPAPGSSAPGTGRVKKQSPPPEVKQTRALAIAESLRWGEPTFHLCPTTPTPGSAPSSPETRNSKPETPAPAPGSLIWAMPLMCNAELLGGIVAEIAENDSASGGVRQAAAALREMIEQRNWTNAALLATHRSQSQIEQHRAEAIHELKTEERYDFHRIYRLEEPALLGAIRRGDRREARAVLNRLLVGMIHAAGARLNLAKSFFLELVVTMTRTAVEAGGDPQELLGSNFASLTELAKIDSDEELAAWLHRSLESVLAGLHLRRESTDQVLLSNALQFMQKHFTEDVSRDDVAEVACMSPSHFSRLFSQHFGRSFSDLLNQLRVDRAAELLVRTDRSLAVIALETGFADQSYFTKVFRKYRGETPADYRRKHEEN